MAQGEERFKYLGIWHDIVVAARPNCHDIVERASALQLQPPAVQTLNVRTALMSTDSASYVGCCCLFIPGARGFTEQRPFFVETDFFS